MLKDDSKSPEISSFGQVILVGIHQQTFPFYLDNFLDASPTRSAFIAAFIVVSVCPTQKQELEPFAVSGLQRCAFDICS